jgi:arylsulfatase A-like enzyme/Flp pilus assembly protein TadD
MRLSSIRRTAVLLALVPLGLVIGCGGGSEPGNAQQGARSARANAGPQLTFPRAPVILISVDTLRSDHLPAYGYDQIETPHFEAFRRDAIFFERAYSHYPLTLPSHCSLLTGLLPGDHGVRDNIGYTLDADKLPYLPRLLHEQGFTTGAAVSTVVLEKPTGLDTGFDFYDDDIDTAHMIGLSTAQRAGDETRAVAAGWLRKVTAESADKPPFFFFHIYEPHSPYHPPEPYASRYKDPYDGDIAFADAVIGRFLDELRALGLYDRSIIVLFSDHGEGLSEHGEAEHGVLLYREALQVPLMLKLPGSALAGTHTAVSAQLVDVAPTVLSLLGLPVPDAMAGDSLLSLLADGAEERPIYSESYYPRLHLGWSELNSLIEDKHHLIQGPDPELYDLAADPGETANILRQERRAYARLKEQLEPFNRVLKRPSTVSEEASERLAALGYLSTSSSKDAEGPLPDPKSRIHLLDVLQQSNILLAQGKNEEAVAAARKLVEGSPEMPQAWINLGLGLVHLNRLEESIAAYKEAVKLGGPQPRLVVRLASLYEAVGNPQEAVRMLQATLDYGVDHPSVQRQLGLSLIAAGRPAEAVTVLQPLTSDGRPAELNAYGIALYESGRLAQAQEIFERVLAEHPDNAKALESLGGVMLAARRAPEALRLLERAVELDQELPIAWNSLGVARQWSGNTAGALEAWQRSLELDPRNLDVLFNLGLVAAESGRRQLAIESLRRFVAQAPPSRAGEVSEARQALARLERG